MKRAVVLLILALGFIPVIVSTPKAFACSCAQPKPPSESLGESAAVFTGKVVNIEHVAGGYDVKFSVEKAWKGVPTSPITIATSEGGGACGYNFENGGEYIVYAYGEEAPFNTSICTRTQSFADAYEDLAYLGEGYIPVAGQPVAEKTPSSPFLPFIGIGAVVAGIIAYIMLRGRRA